MRSSSAFLSSSGGGFIIRRSATHVLPNRCERQTVTIGRLAPAMSTHRPSSRQLSWPKALILAVGAALSNGFGPPARASGERLSTMTTSPEAEHSITAPAKTTSRFTSKNRTMASVANEIPLDVLGIKRDEFLSERELRRRKTTQFSEAEQEIMELEEWEVDTQWFRDLQTLWAALASVAGIFILYKGGVMWENWIKEQERKDMEEEIELTGKFIDPRAVRKDEDGGTSKGNPKNPPPKGDKPSDSGASDQGDDYKPGDIESLEKLFGKS